MKAELKTSELRLGNYIQVEGKICKIDGIQPHWVWFDNISSSNMDNIEPIPLDSDWLLKLGLISSGNERQLLFELPKFIQEKCQADSGYKKSAFFFNNRHDINSYMDCQTRRAVKYVHEIQNLVFALTGEELTIS